MKVREDNPESILHADLIVCIPSFGEASAVSLAALQADEALATHYPDRSAVIMTCDSSSHADSRRSFMQTRTRSPKIYLSIGNGSQVKKALIPFRKAAELSAKAVAVLDARVTDVAPLRIRNLAEPLFQDYHFVAPIAVRDKHAGPMTSNLVYPMIRALYGRRLREPMGREFGFSGRLAHILLDSEFGDGPAVDFEVSIWIATTAVRSRLAVVQSVLGASGVYFTGNGLVHERIVFDDAVRTIFELMCRYDDFWKRVRWSRPTPVFGLGETEAERPKAREFDTHAIRVEVSIGFQEHQDLYRDVLHPENADRLEELTGLLPKRFVFAPGLWAKIIYDFSVAYRNRVASSDALLEALWAVYCAKTLSFILETRAMNSQQVEEYIEDQCLVFEKTKPYLLDRWIGQ